MRDREKWNEIIGEEGTGDEQKEKKKKKIHRHPEYKKLWVR